MSIDSPAKHDSTFNPSMSIYFECENLAEIEAIGDKLATDGELLMPWDNDRFSDKFS